MHNLCIPLASLILDIILITVYMIKSSKLPKENEFYFGMLVDILFMTILCIIAVYLLIINFRELEVVKFINKLQCIFIVNFFTNLLIYIIHACNIKIKNLMIFYWFFLFVLSMLILLNSVDLIATNDLNYMISVGRSIDITTTASIFLLMSTFILSLKYKRVLKEKLIPIIIMILFIVVTILVRILMPNFIVMEFLATIAVLIMYFTIENPDLQLIEQLNFLKIQAESSSKAKNEFMKRMGHEIITPMNHAIGYNDLNKEFSNPEVRENAEIVGNALQQIYDIAMNSMTMNEMLNNNLTLETNAYKTSELFTKVNSLIEQEYKRKKPNLKYIVNIDRLIPRILHGDMEKTFNIFKQLLSNAVKYTTEGYVELSVTSKITENICDLKIKVKDTGIGIKSEDKKKLFSCFERLDFENNQAIARGVGLGLSVTKKIVELMNGEIKVNSVFGAGTEFNVSLKQETLIGGSKNE